MNVTIGEARRPGALPAKGTGVAIVPLIEAKDILSALAEPALLITPQGIVEEANAAAVACAGVPLRGVDLCSLSGPGADTVRTFLARCSGSGGVLLGTVLLPNRSRGNRRYRCRGNLLSSAGRPLIFLRCNDPKEDRFALFTQRIDTLNDELRRHRRTQAVLEESLRERELLVREIHHRVKNNIQILQAMLMSAAHETEHPAAKRGLESAARRVAAMAAVQQALYRSDHPTACQADAFLDALLRSLQDTWPGKVRFDYAADAVELTPDVTTPLALIINELITNALKYGIRDSSDGTVTVRLQVHDGQIELSVQDNGPGFEMHKIKSQSSGLGLVRGLARQLGGRFEVVRNDGARCSVWFPFQTG